MHSDRALDDRFLIALLLAAIIHAVVILGVGFDAYKPPKINGFLAVTLAVAPSQEGPKTADALASENQLGSGLAKKKSLPAPPARPSSATRQRQAEQPPSPAEESIAEAKRKAVLTQSKAEKSISLADGLTDRPKAQPLREEADEASPHHETEAEGVRKVFINSVNAHKYKAAAYERAWQQEIERIGNLNFPDEARRQKLSGSLVMAVALRQDGTVDEVKILHSSGHAVLDGAARRTVELAAPFSPFPAALRKEADILVITRTWRFYNDSRLQTE